MMNLNELNKLNNKNIIINLYNEPDIYIDKADIKVFENIMSDGYTITINNLYEVHFDERSEFIDTEDVTMFKHLGLISRYQSTPCDDILKGIPVRDRLINITLK